MIRSLFLFTCLFPTLLLAAPLPQTAPYEIKAEEFIMDGAKNLVIASGNITMSQDDIIITADYGQYHQDQHRIHLRGNIVMNRKTVKVTCDELVANELDRSVDAFGHVKFRYDDVIGRSDQARYDIKAQTFLLSGNPSIKQGPDVVKGHAIRIDLKTGEIITEGRTRVKLSVEKLQP